MFIFRRRLTAKLNEAEQSAENSNAKVASLERIKIKLQGELEDLNVMVERVCIIILNFNILVTYHIGYDKFIYNRGLKFGNIFELYAFSTFETLQ